MEKIVKNKRIIILIIAIVYTMLTILAFVSTIARVNSNSTIGLNFKGVLQIMWWPVLIIIGLLVVYFLFRAKKIRLGAIVELLLGLMVSLNNIINIILYGTNAFAFIFSFIFPTILILQSISILVFIKNNKKAAKICIKKVKKI